MRFADVTPPRCGSCGRPIRYAILNGQAHPFDAEPTELGDHVVELVGRSWHATHSPAPMPGSLTLEGLAADDRDRYRSHFATCPHAADHRRAS